jgi:hypothetical protein
MKYRVSTLNIKPADVTLEANNLNEALKLILTLLKTAKGVIKHG